MVKEDYEYLGRTELLVIGNGFDLKYHLKTKYVDFFSYLKNNYKKNEKQFSNNLFINYLLNNKLLTFNYWFDFEFEVKQILISFIHFINHFSVETYMKHPDFPILLLQKQYIIGKGDDRIFNINYVKSWKFISRVPNSLDKTSYDSDVIPFYLYNPSSNTEPINKDYLKLLFTKEGIVQFKAKLVDMLYDDLIFLSDLFVKYLKSRVDRSIKKLSEKDRDISDDTSNFCKVISFNYTKTPQLLLGINEKDVLYIHGTYTEKANDIIFGVDICNDVITKSINKDILPYILKFDKNVRRRKISNDHDKYLVDFIKNISLIEVYGHSFNEQDFESLRTILTFKDDIVIQIYCYDGADKKKSEKTYENSYYIIYEKLVRIFKTEEKVKELIDNKKLVFSKSSDFKKGKIIE